ncbi:MAG: hypothetical protein AABX96_03035 [Nanoarchaeota archaeon]
MLDSSKTSVFEGHRNVGALRDLDVSKTSVFEHLEIQVNFSARNFFLKRSFCTEICHVKVRTSTLNIQKSSRNYKKDFLIVNKFLASKIDIFDSAQESGDS